MTTKNLLIELFVEELPPKALKKLGEAFALILEGELREEGLLDEGSVTTAFASPRRLAAHISRVRSKGSDKNIRKKLMRAKEAFEADGKPSVALRKRMEKGSLTERDLVRESENGAEYVFAVYEEPGWSLESTLQFALRAATEQLPIPKVMTYQRSDGWTDEHFVRPAHRLVVLHGSDVVNVDVLGLQAGCETQGHRFEAASPIIPIRDADSYAQQMESEGAVIASFEARRAEISRQLKEAAAREGLHPIDDADLLDEVTALVERPNVLVCRFEQEFLDVPQECLILTMKANQKYFPLLDAAGKLTNKFLVVANIRPADPSAVIGGNERVVRPRLADAKFFFDQDRRKSLMDRIPGLARVVYHNKLGTQGERVERVAALARAIGDKLGGEALANQADRAAVLSKADLLTDMVGEFPELQGIMGRYYALHDGEPAEIADAIEDHYKPRFAGDELPRGTVGLCVALADKLETLAGLFGIGQQPTGDKDPFALRRHALGAIRIIVERNLDLSLHDLINSAFGVFPHGLVGQAHTDLSVFVLERFSGMLREQGYSSQEVEAVMAMNPVRLNLVPKQLAAVRAFAALPEAASLAAANKRVGNILKKVSPGKAAQVDASLLREPAEVALNAALASVRPQADAAFERGDYAASLQALAALKGPVDAFFDHVMVNVDDAALRANRLGLLANLHAAMNRVADLSRLSA